MSVMTASEMRTEIIYHEQTIWRIGCDAWGCSNRLELVRDNDSDGLRSITGPGAEAVEDPLALWSGSVDDAIDIAIQCCGWQQGTRGIQRNHIYCPQHREES